MNIVSVKNWIFKKFDFSDIKKYSENYSLDEIVSKLLSIRKKNIEDINLFLNPTIKNLLPNPLILKDMKGAVERTYKSIKNSELLSIFGDYDVDGVTSTALLGRYFLSINQKIKTYIPDRKKEGYGPTEKGFEKLIDSGAKIIFTVDCGTMSYDPIIFAQNQNVDVIVLDHHQSDTKLPKAHAIVNPNRYDEKSKLNYLCAAGVCFLFLVALNKKLREENWFKDNNLNEPNILNLLDLVSLGTVCDVVPLIGLNRAIVKQGLKVLKKRSNLGLKTLYDLCKINSQPTVQDLGFKLGPRINAGGRVGKSSHGAELLSSEDPLRAYQIAIDLNKSNKERQTIEFILLEQISAEVKKYHNHPVLVLSGNNWHEGIIGIVASRIKEKYNKPTILISLNENLGKGSARSIFGFDIGSQIIQAVQLKILKKGGGHKMAGGFTIIKENISLFRDYLIKNYEKSKIKSSEIVNLYLDSVIAPSALNEEFYEKINLLGPFGAGNSEPKFVIENLKVISSKVVAEKHIKSTLCGKDGTIINSIAFNAKDELLDTLLKKDNKRKFNVAGKMTLNEWHGKKNIEFIIEDIALN
jgi:single-stranded-DNA-specific exonuclease